MQNWVKFVVRTTLVSGGLLMVGPGVASATENVDPDLPASLVDQQVVTPAVVVLGDSLREAKPLQQLETAGRRAMQPVVDTADGAPGAATPAGPVHPAQVASLRSKPLEVTEDVLEPELNGSTASVDLPVLSTLERTSDKANPLATGGELRTPSLPLSGTVVTDPLDPGAGTRVTAVNADAPELGNSHNMRGRSDTTPSASTLPIDMPVSGQLPTIEQIATVVSDAPALDTVLAPLGSGLLSPKAPTRQ
ncbi:hypothetical protein [Amycolatopsis sp. cmx-4-54]|uniref:hypothetical protein n=1 Tax=Amycolatopsis sp. cmx-4-54 TaxID=2790936 RepID=UPI00397A3F41